jgi:hypothetical protein
VHNTIFASAVSWNWKNGWFTSLGFDFQGPDGSTYNGTTNQDYWTFSPTAAVSYIDKFWKATVNMEYDFHTASRGSTGSFAGFQNNVALGALAPVVAAETVSPIGCVGLNCPGIGYTSGQQLFIDWSAEYKWGKLSFGPAGDFKFQTTSDRPGQGWTCPALTTNPFYGTEGLVCGRATVISLGGIIGYNFGPAELDVYAVQDVYDKDDFRGTKIFTRVTFKLDNPAPAASPEPMIGKAQ